jgi:MFS family permease
MERKYPKEFWIMCGGALFFFLSFNIILPELSNFLKSLGGQKHLGWIIPAFSISALLARPLSGWITDNLGRKWTMIGGCIFCIIAGVFYPMVGTVTSFFVVRAIHGFSTGFTPTGFTAFTADTIKPEFRGRAMGWQGTFNNIGTSFGYGLGALIVIYINVNALFIASAIFAVIALILFSMLPETMPSEASRKFQFNLKSLFYLPAWKPSFLMFLVCISLGSILTIMPDYTLELGYSNKGLYLTIYISFSLIFRMFSGSISDAWGRAYSTAIGTFAQIISMILLISNPFQYSFFISAFFYGIGQGFNAPSLFAWASDTATAENRGKALASLFMMLEFGIIFGGYFAGKITMQWGMKAADVFKMNAFFFIIAFVFSVYSILKTPKIAKNS